jgi:hypothetical protein
MNRTAHVQLLQAIGAHSRQERSLLRMQHVPDVRHDNQRAHGAEDEECLDLAGELQESILSEIIDHLQLPGQNHPITADLLHMMVPRERPN